MTTAPLPPSGQKAASDNWLQEELESAAKEVDEMPIIKVRRVRERLSQDERAYIAVVVAC